MHEGFKAVPAEQSVAPLETHYGSIGIEAVAAAVRFQPQPKPQHEWTVIAERFVEAA